MTDYEIGDQVWIISFEVEDEFYLLSKQTITDILDGHIECEDDFNTFHVAPEDIYRTKKEAVNEMINRLQALR